MTDLKGIFTKKELSKLFGSMRFKIVGAVVLVVLAAMILVNVYILGLVNDKLIANERSDMYMKAENIAAEVATVVASMNNTMDNYTPVVSEKTAGTGIRCIIADSTFRVVYDSESASELKGKLLITNAAAHAMDIGGYDELGEYDGTRIMSVCTPVIRTGATVGNVYLMKSVDGVAQLHSSLVIRVIIFSLLVCVLAGIISYLLSRLLTASMNEFKLAAQKISSGDFAVRLPIHGKDEIAELSQAFNYMCAELEHLEEKRHMFVSDASHELKTPMATIKLICDTLVGDGEPDIGMVKEFLNDLSEEIDRLTRIVERLLKLTELDSKVAELKPELVDYGMMLKKIAVKLEPIALGKNITLLTEIKTDDMQPVSVDMDKIWEAVYNIADNAIKYSKIGGSVKLEAEVDGDMLITRVADSGPGVPDKFKEKIFERFYRIDDSRARNTGGTGLGLAITKEIVSMHSGEICVRDGENGGAVFEIRLPYNTTGQGTGEQHE